jgi:hypothetical protein
MQNKQNYSSGISNWPRLAKERKFSVKANSIDTICWPFRYCNRLKAELNTRITSEPSTLKIEADVSEEMLCTGQHSVTSQKTVFFVLACENFTS